MLRPEPGNAATVARVTAAGWQPIALPLFVVRALAWAAPDPADFDAVLFTSANAARHGGAELARLTHLPAFAVGENTAQAARAAGFDVTTSGKGDAAAIVAQARALGHGRLLHLGGRERSIDVPGAIAVYASEPVPVAPADPLTPPDAPPPVPPPDDPPEDCANATALLPATSPAASRAMARCLAIMVFLLCV